MEYKTKGNGQMFMVFDEYLTEEEKKVDISDYVTPNGCIPNKARAAVGLPPINESRTEEKKQLTDKDIQWENLRYWVEQQMSERRWAGDVYRYTAYEGVFKKMEELERS